MIDKEVLHDHPSSVSKYEDELRELYDLRTILSERVPGEKEAEEREEFGDEPFGDEAISIDTYLAEGNSFYCTTSRDREIYCWVEQLARARDRIKKVS